MLAQPNATPIETDVVVVGAGPAGLFQIFQLGLLGLSCHAIEALPHPGGQCIELYPHKPIYDIPALAQVSGAQLAAQLHQQLAPFPIQWHWGQTVQAVEDAPEIGPGWLRVRAATALGQPGATIHAKAVVLALGPGAFVPRLPKLEGLEALLTAQTQVFVQSHDQAAPLAGQRVVIYGGDEAAVAKALQLAQLPQAQRPAHIALLHRRDAFRADDAALAQLQTLREAGRLHVVTGQLEQLGMAHSGPAPHGDVPTLQSLHLLTPEGSSAPLPLDVLLLYQGLAPKLGAALQWGLELEAKHIVVNPATLQTSREGIYAIGDIARYPGKRKLIACGFHEAILCAFAIAQAIQGKPLLTQYTTTSTQLLERLGQPTTTR